jgi:hypothetical protein
MNTIARKLSIFVLVAAAATTALTIGATTTFAASNTHTHHIQLMGNDDSWASSFTHTPINSTGTVGSHDFGGFSSAQYGGVHPHHHHSSTDMIADFNSDNSNSTAGSDDRGGSSSAQYGGVHPHHHHSSTDMIADFNSDNSNSTAGSDDRGGFSSAQYGSSGSHSHHHQNSAANSSWMWPTHRSAPDIVDLN